MAKLSLIIPTLNERGAIRPLMERLGAVLKDADMEVVVVDDGSTDGTADAVRALALPFPVRIVERTERGLATAVLRGFSEASGSILGVMDADGSHPVEAIPTMLRAMETSDLVIGSRLAPGGVVEEWPWARRTGSLTMSALARPLARGVRDPLSGFFFVRREVVEDARFNPVGYKILLELIVKTKPRRIVEVPITFKNREVGKSKMGFWCLPETLRYLRLLGRLYWHTLRRVQPASTARASRRGTSN